MAHRDIVLQSTPQRYALATGTDTLSIARPSGEITLGSEKPAGGVPVAGILGMLRLQFDRYLIVITRARQVGSLAGHVVYLMDGFDMLPMRVRISKDVDEQQYLALVRAHLHGGQFYFSHTLDLTSSLQRQQEQQGQPLWRRADERFFWNRYIMEDFMQTGMDGFILPVVHGFFAIHRVVVSGHAMTFALCTRRSRYRAGTRYFSRGIDADGHVSNFNETEQIIVLGPSESTALAYVQTRGSVPAYWAEVINLKYKPGLRILSSEAEAAALHFQEQTAIYGRVVCVNLVNQKGHELPVKSTFENIVRSLAKANVKYVYFDFHYECRGLRWDRVQVLIDQVQGDLEEAGYFMLDATRRRIQTGVVRTNCMDCLDRTNVVQSSLALWTLDRQLRDIGILRAGESAANDTVFATTFRNVWADNADAVSRTYSGTGALKTDFTRLGRRTKAGALQDFSNSAIRYLRNNFLDGPRQDGFDIFLGNFHPYESVGSPFVDHRPVYIQSVPYILLAALLLLAAAVVLPRSSERNMRLFIFFWLCVAIAAVRFVAVHGLEYVSWPKLIPLEYVDGSNATRGRAGSFRGTLEEGRAKKRRE